MSTYLIVTTSGSTTEASSAFTHLTYGESSTHCTDCAWLFSADSGVKNPENAIRAVAIEYFRSADGQRVRRLEEMESIYWRDAITWVPDELWRRHGLTLHRHPEVERIVLDEKEDLAEEPVAGRNEATIKL